MVNYNKQLVIQLNGNNVLLPVLNDLIAQYAWVFQGVCSSSYRISSKYAWIRSLTMLKDGSIACGIGWNRNKKLDSFLKIWKDEKIQIDKYQCDQPIEAILELSDERLMAICCYHIMVWDKDTKKPTLNIKLDGPLREAVELTDGRVLIGGKKLYMFEDNKVSLVETIYPKFRTHKIKTTPYEIMACDNRSIIAWTEQRTQNIFATSEYVIQDFVSLPDSHFAILVGDLNGPRGDNLMLLYKDGKILKKERMYGMYSNIAKLTDGRYVTGGRYGTFILWSNGKPNYTRSDLSPGINTLCSLPNGRLISGGIDGTISFWE